MEQRQTCGELAALVREQGPQAIRSLKWLDEYADAEQAAAFTGLSVSSVRMYHGQAVRRRKAGDSCEYWPKKGVPVKASNGWMWPAPDITIAKRPAWRLRTIVLGRAAMPGLTGGAKSRQHYPPDVKTSAVARVQAGETIRAVAADIGVPKTTVGGWVKA